MEVLTTESLEKLRSECKLNPELVLMNFQDIVEKYNLVLIPLNDFNFDLKELIIKKAITSNSMGVKNNMIRIFPNKLNKKLNPKKKITRKEIIL